MVPPGSDDDRRRLLAATDHLLDRIEELRLADRVELPEPLRTRLAAVAASVDPRARPRVPTTLAGAHDQVFRLQTKLLRASGTVQRAQQVQRRRTAPGDAARLFIPPRESAGNESDWLESVRLTVQRAQDRARYLAAQVVTATTSPFASEALRTNRHAQAAEAQRAFADLARDARRITGRSLRLDPLLTLPESGRFEVGDLIVEHDGPDVLQSGRPVRLTEFQRRILIVLAANSGRVVTREALQHVVTRADPLLDVRSKVMHVHVAHLRAKLGSSYVETVPGVGYRLSSSLRPPDAPSSATERTRRQRREQRGLQVGRSSTAEPADPSVRKGTNDRRSGR